MISFAARKQLEDLGIFDGKRHQCEEISQVVNKIYYDIKIARKSLTQEQIEEAQLFTTALDYEPRGVVEEYIWNRWQSDYAWNREMEF